MAAGAEFPCGVPGGGEASALRWMRCGGSVESVLWWMRCGGSVESMLWWMRCGIGAVVDAVGCGIGVFCRRVFVDFCWWGGYTKGTYLGTFWAVRLSDPHMVGCINMAGKSRLVV